MKTKELTQSAFFIMLIGICAQITIPLPVIPFSLQLFAISLMGLYLPRKQTLYTILIYILIGLLGIPVFANGQAGLAMILKPSFAFVVGFIPFVLVIKKNPIIAWILLYLSALPLLYLNLRYIYELNINLLEFITAYSLIFIPSDSFQIFIAHIIKKKLS